MKTTVDLVDFITEKSVRIRLDFAEKSRSYWIPKNFISINWRVLLPSQTICPKTWTGEFSKYFSIAKIACTSKISLNLNFVSLKINKFLNFFCFNYFGLGQANNHDTELQIYGKTRVLGPPIPATFILGIGIKYSSKIKQGFHTSTFFKQVGHSKFFRK